MIATQHTNETLYNEKRFNTKNQKLYIVHPSDDAFMLNCDET